MTNSINNSGGWGLPRPPFIFHDHFGWLKGSSL